MISLADGSDFASVERNVLAFKGFGSTNKETVAELFVSLMSKLLSAESLWEHGLCASNFEASWISKTWKKGVGNLNVEDFLDRSQNFARSVGKKEMHKICKCLRDCALSLLDFMRGKLDTSKLKSLLFGCLNPDELVSKPRLKHAKTKCKAKGMVGWKTTMHARRKQAVAIRSVQSDLEHLTSPKRNRFLCSRLADCRGQSPLAHRLI
ncbi:hypothetical protein GUJ93_ZPchr0009g1973 [Zizania palustris]|uniref:Uncharacterized protein n=1 Tax=Zizania palustris TaxID=103762 RepID=A0A8J5R384_ZIZPA|nr:hypothetical protein GUJ93_ZPchr0009g1973 [Zizania palustris]